MSQEAAKDWNQLPNIIVKSSLFFKQKGEIQKNKASINTGLYTDKRTLGQETNRVLIHWEGAGD